MQKTVWLGKAPRTIGSTGVVVNELSGNLLSCTVSEVLFGNAGWSPEKHVGKILRISPKYGFKWEFRTIDDSLLPSLGSEEEVFVWFVQKIGLQETGMMFYNAYETGIKDGIKKNQRKMKKLLGLPEDL